MNFHNVLKLYGSCQTSNKNEQNLIFHFYDIIYKKENFHWIVSYLTFYFKKNDSFYSLSNYKLENRMVTNLGKISLFF